MHDDAKEEQIIKLWISLGHIENQKSAIQKQAVTAEPDSRWKLLQRFKELLKQEDLTVKLLEQMQQRTSKAE